MDNRHVVVDGCRLRLVPYLPHHVRRYHEWMSDPRLLELTCSEPLSLEEEVENQKSWLEAHDKLTFILLAPRLGDDGRLRCQSDAVAQTSHDSQREWEMVGDCNAFIGAQEPDVAEVEVSVSELAYRRLGVATEAIRLLMSYLAVELGKRQFEAKILTSNTGSIALFRDVLGFSLHKEVKVFDEVHFRTTLGDDAAVAALVASSGYRRGVYASGALEGPATAVLWSTWADRAARVLEAPTLLRASSEVAQGGIVWVASAPYEAHIDDALVGAVAIGPQQHVMHSRHANAILLQAHLVAVRAIAAGEPITVNAAIVQAHPTCFPFPDPPFTVAADAAAPGAVSEPSPMNADATILALPDCDDRVIVLGRGAEYVPATVFCRWICFADAPVRRACYSRGFRPISTSAFVDIRGAAASGYLTFASVTIPQGTTLWRFEGLAVPFPTTFTLEMGQGRHVLFAADGQCMAHLCRPNLRIVPRDEARCCFDVVSTQEVAAGEIIGFDYNTTEWSMSEAFQCCCCPEHPKSIQGYRHLSAEDQAALLPHVAPWIARRVAH